MLVGSRETHPPPTIYRRKQSSFSAPPFPMQDGSRNFMRKNVGSPTTTLSSNNKLDSSDYRTQALVVGARTRNAVMLEDVALMELRDGRFPTAIATLEQARGAYTKRDDIIRCVLEECDALIKFGKPNRALDLTRRVLRIIPESPALQLLHKMESDLTKPSPRTPTPP